MKRKGRRNRYGCLRQPLFACSLFATQTFIVGFILLFVDTSAQTPVLVSFKSYGLDHDEDNVIHNAAHLEDFLENLFQQKTSNDRKISIVHIGDSHIQADYLTSVVRRNFQQMFGNAGRGLIVPYRVAGTNEPANFISRSSGKWISKRCVYPDQPLPIGIGGITVSTTEPNASLEIHMNDLWVDYTFNAISVFYKKGTSSFNLSILDTANNQLATIDSFGSEPFTDFARVYFDHPVSSATIRTVKTNEQQVHATLFGLCLENGDNGIFYHAIGVNGAKYTHYNAAQMFAAQTAALQPELFIISLGTNESVEFPYVDKNLSQHIEKFIGALRTRNPLAKFILVTPPDAYRKKIKRNPGIQEVRQHIINYAVENGYAFYDMYKALGGDNAADQWRKAGLLRADGIHFSKEGYEYQGNLLFQALMKSYNQYVPLRHP